MAESEYQLELSVAKKQLFDIQELGTQIYSKSVSREFSNILEPAQRLIMLYNMISVDVFILLSVEDLKEFSIRSQFDYKLFQNINEFIRNRHMDVDHLISQINESCRDALSELGLLVALSSHTLNLNEDNMKSFSNQAHRELLELEGAKNEAQAILRDIREVSAIKGVAQQSGYFDDECKTHSVAATSWLRATVFMSFLLVLYSFASLFIHKIEGLEDVNVIHLSVSKSLIFAVLSYMLYFSVKSYMVHRHNAVVNRHRQNALMTYKAILDASNTPENRDIILKHAASCIFSPQPTGYSKEGGADAPVAKSVVELLGGSITPK